MTDANHEKKIQKIEAEMVELRKQIMQIEFISKRDHATAQRELEAAQRESEAAHKEFDRMDMQIQKRLDYIAKLAGITYDELSLLEEKIQDSGRVLARPRKHSTLS